ncbi:MAG: hypothetical protein OEX05_06265, partial [Chloroflexota bacterium]|nr:hypothetical protein [Chloroflexota bacterium]
MSPVEQAALTVAAIAVAGALVALLAGPVLRRRGSALKPAVVRARALSYAMLAGVLVVALLVGLPAVTVLVAAIAGAALLEWSRLATLPTRHVVALELSSLVVLLG